MTATRPAGRLIVAAALLGAGVLGFAAPATAAGSDSVTIDNASNLTIQSGQSLSVASLAKATCRLGLNNRRVILTLTGPSGPAPTTTTMKTDHVPCNQDAALTTSISSPKRNGSYTVALENSNPNHTTTADLDVLIPPARAKGFSVSTAGTIASFSWTANPESDVVSYQVLNGSGGVAKSTAASDACAGGATCATSLDLGPSAAGTTQRFSVRAVRCGLSCSAGTVTGSSSSAGTATFGATTPAPTPTPTATPAPTPTHHSGRGTGRGSSGGGGGRHAGRGAGSTSGHPGGKSHQSTATGANVPPHLRGLQSLNKPVLGKSAGNFQYPAPQVAKSAKPARSTTRAITHDIATGFSLPPLWRGIAAAAILLLLAMHLRTWVSRLDLS